MNRPDRLRVVVVGPPISASGGIGRVMSAALGALPDDEVSVRVLDSRGLGRSPLTSLVPLLRCCATLLWLGRRRGVDVVHVNTSSHGSAIRKGLVVRVCHLVGAPVVLHLHASSFPEFYDALPSIARRWVRRTFGLATRVVVLAEFWRRYVVEVLQVPQTHVAVLPNATAAARATTAPRRAGDPLQILFLGRLGERKGVPELLAALADERLAGRPWRATLAGDGEVDHYRSEAAARDLADRTTFTGWVEGPEVQDLLAAAHVLVLPSHAEGLPMSVLEAFATGLPVVCTPVGGLPEVVADGTNGLLVAEGDVPALAGALRRLLDDEDLRRRLGAGALATWRRDLSLEPFVHRLLLEWRSAARRTSRVPGTTAVLARGEGR